MAVAPGRRAKVEGHRCPGAVRKYTLKPFIIFVQLSECVSVVFVKLREPSCKCSIDKFGIPDKCGVAAQSAQNLAITAAVGQDARHSLSPTKWDAGCQGWAWATAMVQVLIIKGALRPGLLHKFPDVIHYPGPLLLLGLTVTVGRRNAYAEYTACMVCNGDWFSAGCHQQGSTQNEHSIPAIPPLQLEFELGVLPNQIIQGICGVIPPILFVT
jgi:hypothetical protein